MKERELFFNRVLSADLSELATARGLMEEIGKAAGLPEDRIFDLKVAVSEACANAIEHAGSSVEVSARILAGRLIVQITNDGAFQPGVQGDGGRRRSLGLPLMVALADQIHVTRLAGAKTQVSLTFFLKPEVDLSANLQSPRLAQDAGPDEVEHRYQNLVDLSPDAIVVDADGEHVFANPAAARLLGASSPDELVGMSVMEHIDPDFQEIVSRRIESVLAGAISPPREIRLVRLDGSTVDAEVTASRVEFGGRPAVQAILRDITERKQAEKEIRALTQRLTYHMEHSPLAVIEWGPDMRLIRWSGEAERMFGWSAEEVLGKRIEDFRWVHVDDTAQVAEVSAELRDGTNPRRFSANRNYRKDGSIVDCEWYNSSLLDESGRLQSILSLVLDVTERKRAEEARERSERGLVDLLAGSGRLHFLDRRRWWLVLLAGAIIQIGLFAGVDQLGSPSHYLGIPGAATALIAVVAAIVGGPITGISVAFIGGLAYFAFLTDFGSSVAAAAIVLSILLWILAAAMAGLAGDWVRHNALERENLLGHMLNERVALTDSLESTNAQLQTRNEELAVREEELHQQTMELAAQSEELLVQNEELTEAHSRIEGLLQEQNSLFRRLQETLLDVPKELPSVRFSHLYRSATFEAEVGGDFYDVFEAKHGRIGLLIGDVSGHGVEAARVATLVKDTVHAFAHQFMRPHLVLRETNRLLVGRSLALFVTVFVGFLDPKTGELTFSSAGHPPPLLAEDIAVTTLNSIGPPLGVFADARYRDSQTVVPKGSVLLLYTDGVTEARRDGDLYGEQRLVECLRLVSRGPLEALPSLVLDDATAYSGGLLRDDAALLAVQFTGGAVDEVQRA